MKAVIFDMDGVISDTQKLHSRVESELLAQFGVTLTPQQITEKYSGVRTKDFFQELLFGQGHVFDIDELMDRKWQRMKGLASGQVDAIDGSRELIKTLYDNGLPLAVASASNLNYVQSVLDKLNVTKYFKSIISGDMVTNGKPDPEIFLLASNKLEIVPEECLVIEDGISGMEAARKANMFCIGLVPNLNKNYPTNNKVLSLREITIDYLRDITKNAT